MLAPSFNLLGNGDSCFRSFTTGAGTVRFWQRRQSRNQVRWENDYLIGSASKNFTNLFAFSPDHVEAAARLMRAAVDGGREPGRQVYRRVGRPCSRCGARIRSWGQGDDNRMTYWCPGCQAGDDPPRA